MTEKYWKIKQTSTGLFSMGGSDPRFNKTGKIWKQKGHLTSHLNQISRFSIHKYNNCEIIEYEVKPKEVSRTSVMEHLISKKLEKEKQQQEAQARRDEIEKAKRKQQWEELNKEFSNNQNGEFIK